MSDLYMLITKWTHAIYYDLSENVYICKPFYVLRNIPNYAMKTRVYSVEILEMLSHHKGR